MYNVVQAIICSQFDREFGRSSKDPSRRDVAMQIKFSLSNDYDVEDGYRHLHILIYGGGKHSDI